MAAVTFDLLGAAEFAMKRYYAKAVQKHTYKKRPLLTYLPKKTGVVGGSPFGNARGGYQVPLWLDDIAGESGDFASAVSARDGYEGIVWDMNRVKRYATHEIDGETIDAMTGVGAFMEAGRPLMDSAINQVANSMEYMFFHNGTGSRGQIDAGYVSGTTFELSADSSYLARSLGINRTIVTSSTESGGTVDGSTGAKITAITLKKANGKAEITVDSATGLAASQYIFVLGDYQATGANPVAMDGLQSWGPDPATITGGDDFKGVDRSVWKEKLLLLHGDVALQSTKGDGSFVRGIREVLAEAGQNEGSPDALFVSYGRWAQIESDLMGRARYDEFMRDGPFKGFDGFDSLVINAAGGRVNIVASPWCPPNKGFALQRDTWELFSTRQIPGPVSRDGNLYHRLEAKDAVEFRIGGYGNLACKSPGKNMVLNFLTS